MANPMPDIEPAVIAAAQAGDTHAHGAIYALYSNRLFTLIYRLVQRRAMAEDLLQEVFIEVLRSVSSYRGTGPFGGWLRTIAVHKCLRQLRSPWHRSVLWLDDTLAQVDAEHQTPPLDAALSMQSELAAALRHLTPVSRAVVWLHDVEGYTHSEISQQLGRTTSFSKSQLARAHARLRELLNTHQTHSQPRHEEPPVCTSVTQPLSTNS
jgi:RNA polymerase sigma-70 factor (ECF subfamily)